MDNCMKETHRIDGFLFKSGDLILTNYFSTLFALRCLSFLAIACSVFCVGFRCADIAGVTMDAVFRTNPYRKKEFIFDFGYDVELDLLDIFKIHETTQGFEGDPYDIYSQDDFRFHYEPYARQDIRYRFEQKYGSARRSSDYEYDFY